MRVFNSWTALNGTNRERDVFSMKQITRRRFIEQSLIGTGALALSPGIVQGTESSKRIRGTDIVELANTGIKVSRLAMGTGMSGRNQSSALTRKGEKEANAILHHSYEEGIRFYDMADLYGTHPYVRNALKEIPRDQYVLLTKIWFRENSWAKPSGGAIEEVNRYRKELGADMIDICLIHCVIEEDWAEQQKRIRDELSELKQQGAVRAVGVSCHSHPSLKTAAEHPWVDVIFARINHMGGSKYKMDGTVEEITATIKTARANGKAVVGMKIFGEGTLVKPEEKDASLKYVLGNDIVDAITIGMLSQDEINDTLTRIAAV